MPTQADLADFLGTVLALGIEAVNFYTWDACRTNLPAFWETICAFRLSGALPANRASGKIPAATVTKPSAPAVQPASRAEPDDFSRQFLSAMNSRKAERVAALYAANATRVHGDQTVHGTAAIQVDFTGLFESLPEGVNFVLVNVGIQGIVRTITWRAGSLAGLTTLVVEGGKITQDYTHLA